MTSKKLVGYDIKVDGTVYTVSYDDYSKLTDSNEEYSPISLAWSSCDAEPLRCGLRDKLPIFCKSEELAELRAALLKIGVPLVAKEKAEHEAYERKERARLAAEKAESIKKAEAMLKKCPLPDYIKAEDFARPDYRENEQLDYGSETARTLSECSSTGSSYSIVMRYTTGFGWCVPTLRIANARRLTGGTSRDYAVRISDGATVRVGMGPHVLFSAELYFKKSNADRLKPLLELMRGGAMRANEIRDRISSRRANSAMRRRFFI